MKPRIAFTAVFLKTKHGYVGFVEELPNVNSHGTTIDEARQMLHTLAGVVFDEERRRSHELVAGKPVIREAFVIPALPAWPAREGSYGPAGYER
jgi:predicted RNase H-like HicB family nuclease